MTSGILDLSGVRESKKRRKRFKKIIKISIIFSIILILIFLVWVVCFSTVFAVKNIEVTGTKLLNKNQVIKTAAIENDIPLVRVNKNEIVKRIKRLVQVKDVVITNSWPNTVKIKVMERKLVYQEKNDKGYNWIDESGVVFNNNSIPQNNIPVAVINMPPDKDSYIALANVVQKLTPDLKTVTKLVQADSQNSIQLILAGDRKIIWGSDDQSELKSKIATLLLKTSAKTIDVSSPSHPATK